MGIGDTVLGFANLLGVNCVLHQRREPAKNVGKSFRLLHQQPGERAMISTKTKLAAKQILSEILESTDDCETFSFERGIGSLRRRQFCREEPNYGLDSTVITL